MHRDCQCCQCGSKGLRNYGGTQPKQANVCDTRSEGWCWIEERHGLVGMHAQQCDSLVPNLTAPLPIPPAQYEKATPCTPPPPTLCACPLAPLQARFNKSVETQGRNIWTRACVCLTHRRELVAHCPQEQKHNIPTTIHWGILLCSRSLPTYEQNQRNPREREWPKDPCVQSEFGPSGWPGLPDTGGGKCERIWSLWSFVTSGQYVPRKTVQAVHHDF